MGDRDEALVGRLDRLGVERLARAAGLPDLLAARVAAVVVGTGLRDDRRAEVFRELVAHFEDGLAAGRSPEELARAFGDGAAAARLYGSEKRVVTPESAGGSGKADSLIATVWRDTRYAARRLAARPVFTTIAILSLAIGIGANSAMFTLINDIVLRKAPVDHPEELVELYRTTPDFAFGVLSYPEYEDLARLTEAFSGVVASRLGMASRFEGDRSERLGLQLVTGNYFGMLGLRVALGRTIGPADASAPGEGAVVVLTDRYWRRAFGADKSVIGRTMRMSGREYTIIGVTGSDFQGGFRTLGIDAILPVTMIGALLPDGEEDLVSRGNNAMFVTARVAPGVSLPQVRALVGALGAQLHDNRVQGWEGNAAFEVIPTSDVILFPPIDRVLQPIAVVLVVVVGLVLLIACANLAGFLLARAVDRRKEIAVRVAIGATRGRLVTQLLIETLLLALAGGAAGLVLGQAALRLVLSAELPIPLPIGVDVSIDGRVLFFSVAVSMVAGIAFGLFPALQATRLDLASVIRDESTGGGRSKGRLRQALIVAQVTVSVVLLIGAGLFIRSVGKLKGVDPGFGQGNGVLVWLAQPNTLDPAEGRVRRQRLVDEIARLPGVRTTGGTSNVHLNLLSTSSGRYTVDGVEPPPGEVAFVIDHANIDSGYVNAIGLTLLEGRNISAADTDSGARPVALVNEAFAAKFWPTASAVGRRFRSGANEIEVVGVVNTARIRSLAEPPTPFVYRTGRVDETGWIVIESAIDAETQLAAVLRTIQAVEPEILLLDAKTNARHLSVLALPLQISADLLSIFALVALIMASIGLYGTVSYSVAQRSREMGIRLSLGAQAGSVVRLLMWDGLKLVVGGVAAGLVLGVVLGRLLDGVLFGVTAFDPVTMLAVPAALVAVSFAAAYLPARRAGRIDPVRAIRAD